MIGFLAEHYAQRFIPEGGSKVKWILGTPGAGKSHALKMLEAAAAEAGLLAVALDAGEVPLRGIQEFTQAVLSQLDTTAICRGLCDAVIQKMGYDAASLPPDTALLAWMVAERGRIHERAAAEIREEVDRAVSGVDADLSLKVAVSLKMAELLGVPSPDPDTLAAWILGQPLKKPLMARLGITQALNRQNARAILQGWASLARAAGRGGLLITVDRLEQLVAAKSPGSAVSYTPLRREEAYEMLREFIDDGDELPGLWLVLAARPELFSDEKRGIPSYPALKDRVSTEVKSVELNRFLDQLEWDRILDSDDTVLRRAAQAWAGATGGTPRVAPLPGAVSPMRRTVLASVGPRGPGEGGPLDAI